MRTDGSTLISDPLAYPVQYINVDVIRPGVWAGLVADVMGCIQNYVVDSS